MRRTHLLFLALLTACGGVGGADTTSPSSTSTTVITTTTVPPTTTTIALGVEEVVDAFVGYITSPDFQSEAVLDMEVSVGDLVVEASGHSLLHGEDYQSILNIGTEVHETISVGGTKYERENDGPWISDERKATPFAGETAEESPPLEMVAMMKTIGDLVHQSTVEEEGMTLHQIGLAEGESMDSVAFGYAPDYPVEIEVVFWAKDEGSPHRFDFVITDSGDPDLVFTTRLEMTFMPTSAPVEISPPDNPWLRHHSDDFEYTIAHPRGWDVNEYRGAEFPAGDFYLGLDGTEMDVYRSDLDNEEVSLNSMVNDLRSVVIADGFEAGQPEEIEIAGLPGRLFSYRGDDGTGGSVLAIYAVTQTSPDAIFEFLLFSEGTDPEGASQLLGDFLSTFEVTG